MTDITKKCCRCEKTKAASEFQKDNRSKSGLTSACKDCENARGREKYLRTRDRVLKKQTERRSENPEKHRAQGKSWYERNKEKNLARTTKWRRNNPEKARAYTKKWEAANPGSRLDRNRRRLRTPRGRIENAIRAGINKEIRSVDKRGNKTFDILGYSPTTLMRHLEKQFADGMSWDNYGHGYGCWHIEHKIPVVAHNYDTPYDLDFKDCWSLKNLRPLWAEENWSKNDKLDKPFQPSLALAVPTAANDNEPKHKCPIGRAGCTRNCGDYGCGN